MEFMKKITEITQKVGETAVDTYKTVADKSEKLFKETKGKMEIAQKEDEIEKIYNAMGETVFDMYKKGEDVGDAFTKECKKITKILSDIDEANKIILYNKGLRTCSNCAENIALNDTYCSNCGAKQKPVKIKMQKEDKAKAEQMEQDVVERVCPKCGTINEAEAKFCKKCGYKF